ncbi:MAG TPA: hypothetical protein VM513_35465 [Kofleriaceae bacterium]|jgi:hypothetical protein|nr:hypothetical protein [Kofleriaceae bacterium]
MARKQAELPGIERQIENPVVEEAAQAFVDANETWKHAGKTRTKKHIELLAQMRTHGIERYEFPDENGELLVAEIVTGDEKVVVRKTGEADVEIGEGVEASGDVTGGLLEDAARVQAANGVEVDDDGNVVPPDVAAPKAKRSKGKKRS